MQDQDFIDRLRSGDGAAFEQLVKSTRRTVLNICFRFLLNAEDAEDLSQEVFVEVFRSIRHFRGDAQLTTWIHRIAVTRSLDELKSRNRKKRFTSLGRALGLEAVVQRFSVRDQPDRSMEEKESFTRLLKALDTLPENQRIALSLSKVEGFSNPDIADVMQTTVEAVESLIYRAKKNLGNYLDRQRRNA